MQQLEGPGQIGNAHLGLQFDLFRELKEGPALTEKLFLHRSGHSVVLHCRINDYLPTARATTTAFVKRQELCLLLTEEKAVLCARLAQLSCAFAMIPEKIYDRDWKLHAGRRSAILLSFKVEIDQTVYQFSWGGVSPSELAPEGVRRS